VTTVHQAFRFALDPTPTQARHLRSHCGAARFAFNWGLARVKDRLTACQAGENSTVPWTLPALRREWNQVKQEVAPWWAENSKEAYSSGLEALARALRNWSSGRATSTPGRRIGFPRFKRKGRGPESCRFTTGSIRVEPDRHHVALPRLGMIRTHESTRKLARRIEHGTARILSATVSCRADRWFVSFTVEVERNANVNSGREVVVGVDAGVHHLAVLSTGEIIENPRPGQSHLRKLRRLNRELARRRPGSRHQAVTRRRLASLHAHARYIRQDHLHKLTTRLAKQYDVVVVEQLNVAGMLRNRPLARAVADSSMAELRRLLAYKTAWYGSRMVAADPWFPSSKTCSACGHVKAKLGLAERLYVCDSCGLKADRDLNAALNLAQLAAGSGAEAQKARGPDVSLSHAEQSGQKREASAGYNQMRLAPPPSNRGLPESIPGTGRVTVLRLMASSQGVL
jgi:putative transposase